MSMYEARTSVMVQDGGPDPEELAHEVYKLVHAYLTGRGLIPRDVAVHHTVLRYDGSGPDAEAVVVWPTDH
jgi:hypothetical protein